MISSPKVCPKASPARPDLRLSGTVILTIALLGSPTIFGDRFPHDSVQRPRSAGVKADDDVRPVLWREPTDLEHRDLFYGS